MVELKEWGNKREVVVEQHKGLEGGGRWWWWQRGEQGREMVVVTVKRSGGGRRWRSCGEWWGEGMGWWW